MSDIMTAFWGMTINNYDETDLALVRQGYPDFIRQIVYTLEAGTEKKTPHIQAYVRLFRQQRMSYIRKLFPGASDFKALTNDEYKLNCQRYAQKLDETAQSPATITNNPFPDPVVELTAVIEHVFSHCTDRTYQALDFSEFNSLSRGVEKLRVREKPSLAKFYVSATYKNVKRDFWDSIAAHLMDKERAERKLAQNSLDTHTHTHNDEKLSRQGGIPDGEDDYEGEGESGTESVGTGGPDQGDEDSEGEETERSSESGSVSGSSQDDCEGSGEQSDWE